MRIALCLECSRLFEEMRGNTVLYDTFMEDLDAAEPNSPGPVKVKV